MSVEDVITAAFPGLADDDLEVTSPSTPIYNCIAWAAGDDSSHWWPAPGSGPPLGGYYWPAGLPSVESVDNFVAAFKRQGYREIDSGDLEPEFERVAIYTLNGTPTHAARQLEDGSWTSKLGDANDVSHKSPQGVEGLIYGEVALFMRRKRKENRPPPGANDEFFAAG